MTQINIQNQEEAITTYIDKYAPFWTKDATASSALRATLSAEPLRSKSTGAPAKKKGFGATDSTVRSNYHA